MHNSQAKPDRPRGLPILGRPAVRTLPDTDAIRARLIAERIVLHASPEALILALTRLRDVQARVADPD